MDGNMTCKTALIKFDSYSSAISSNVLIEFAIENVYRWNFLRCVTYRQARCVFTTSWPY